MFIQHYLGQAAAAEINSQQLHSINIRHSFDTKPSSGSRKGLPGLEVLAGHVKHGV